MMLNVLNMDSGIPSESKQGFLRLITYVNNISILALAFFCKLFSRRVIVILMYHTVGVPKDFYSVDPAEFERQIDYLKENYAIVSLDEIVGFVKNSKKIPRKCVALTFDDGSQDLYANVYPYLRKNNLPATVFVTTGYVEKNWPFDNRNHFKMLAWKQIEEMSNNNIEFGAHTVSHPDLERISLEEAKREILCSKIELEEHIKKRVRFFSYPSASHTQEIVDIVMSSGFEAAVGGGGTVGERAKIFVLNRVQVDSSVSFMLFKARLTKSVDVLRMIKQTVKKLSIR